MERQPLFAYLARALHDVFVAAPLFQAARAAGVELVRADADLRAQTEFVAIVEPRAGVDHDCGRIYGRGELLRRTQVVSHDGLGVLGAVLGNMVDGFFEISYNL